VEVMDGAKAVEVVDMWLLVELWKPVTMQCKRYSHWQIRMVYLLEITTRLKQNRKISC